MAPESVVGLKDQQLVLDTSDCDEEPTVMNIIEGSPEVRGVKERSRIGIENSTESRSNSNSSAYRTANSRGNRINESTNGSSRKSYNGNRTWKSKIGGNRGQLLIDPWLSTDVSVPGPGSDPSESSSGGDSPSHRDTEGPERSRRASVGRSRFDHEPLILMSTSATTPGMLRDETPGPSFASPRKQPVGVIEINCSDQEEVEIDESQVQRRTMLDRGYSDKRKEDKNVEPLLASTVGRINRRHLVRSNSSLLSINVISSSDDEHIQQPRTPIRRRRIAREILDSSDDDVDELSRDTGRNTLKSSTNHYRNSLHPVADDTIPRPSRPREGSVELTSVVLPGSTAKMPWSITEGPDRDIVLSTPTSKQRIRRYNVILDSEDDFSETEKLPDIWPVGERKDSVLVRHLGLPQIDTVVGDEIRKSPSRAIVSDSEAEFGTVDAASADQSDIFVITQSTVGGCDETGAKAYVVESQDVYELPERSRISPDRETQKFQSVTKLRKPRPLILDIPSDEDADYNTGRNLRSNDTKDIKEQDMKLRDTLMFEDIPKDRTPSPSPEQLLRKKSDPKKEQAKSENSSFSFFPLFNRTMTHTQTKLQQEVPKIDENKYGALWKRKKETEDKRPLAQVSTVISEEEDEDEVLEDSRTRRHSGRARLVSPTKKIRLSEIAPDVAVMESALKAEAVRGRQQANGKGSCSLSRMETIESFSTLSDSQRTLHRIDSFTGRIISQAEEIEGFSDDHRSQMPERRQEERRIRRYSGLQLVSRDESKGPLDGAGVENPKLRLELSDDEEPQDSDQTSPDLHKDRGISPTLSEGTMERCPICRMMIPAKDLLAHVDAELLANEQREKEDMERRDEAMAYELNEIYQTQDAVVIRDSLPENEFMTQDSHHLQPLTQAKPFISADRRSLASPKKPAQSKDWCGKEVSLDTPTRKVGSLSLDASPLTSKIIEQKRDRDTGFSFRPLHKIKSSSTVLSDDQLENEQDQEHDSFILSEVESISSQSAFKIQPGQIVINDTPPASSETTVNVGLASRKSTHAQNSHKESHKKPESGDMLDPFVIQNEILDDDLDDFLDRPEPASMMSRPFRTNTNTNGKTIAKAVAPSRSSARRNSRVKAVNTSKKKPSKGMIELDDSGDEPDYDGGKNEDVMLASKRATGAKGSKSKSTVLDGLLPTSVRQRRQYLLKKTRGQRNSDAIDVEDEIEIGRHHLPVVEKLWNQEDDLFDSEYLDPRQVKGVGLGGVVGGIGAIPGSLAMSKITKNTAAIATTDFVSEIDIVSQRTSSATVPKHNNPEASFEFEDTDYGLHSQDWWDNPQLDDLGRSRENNRLGGYMSDHGSHRGFEEHGDQERLDDGYTSPLDDFVDLRERRDDPALAMYFAQFESDIGLANEKARGSRAGGRNRGRGRGRSGASGSKTSVGKKGMSFGPGIGPMSTTMGTSSQSAGPAAGQAVLTAYGIPRRIGSTMPATESVSVDGHDRYGARKVSFGGRATTENGSMAIRSKPTQPFVPGKSKGRGTIIGITPDKSDQDHDQSDVTYKILYLKLHGLAATTRIILAVAGVQWESIYPTDWNNEKQNVPLGVLPVLYEHHASTGLVLEIPESEVIERYLARKFGLLGRDAWEETTINVFYSSSNAVMSLYVNKVLLAFSDTKARELAKFVEKHVPAWIKQHEKWLMKNDGYYVGDQLSLADIRSVVCLDRFLTIPECKEMFSSSLTPGLFRLKRTLEANTRYSAWIASDEFEAINISTRQRLAVLSG
ncbi:Glutathione S-transferase S1 [Mortierella sp. AD010]|nr:Glutathione S-transferase S1 [Mortierella sp. AD010]